MNRVTRNDPRDAWMAAALRSRLNTRIHEATAHVRNVSGMLFGYGCRLDERLEIIDHLSECPACAEAWSSSH